MRILFIGDIVGQPARNTLKRCIPELKYDYKFDICIANAENAAGGSGISPKVADELFSFGIDILTSGDHIWRNKEIFSIINRNDRILRPANYPDSSPGHGCCVINTNKGITVGVINLLGRVFMNPIDSPFVTVINEIEKIKNKTKIIIVDFHAEATSEKIAMGWYLDGKVSAVLGTHTHVPTADNKILPNGTAYITDVGMVGAKNSVLGRDIEPVVRHFVNSLPQRFTVADGDISVQGVIIEIDETTGFATRIERIDYE